MATPILNFIFTYFCDVFTSIISKNDNICHFTSKIMKNRILILLC